MRVRILLAWAVAFAAVASTLACTSGTTPDCDSGTVQCGYGTPPPVSDAGGGTDGDAATQHEGGSDAGGSDAGGGDAPSEGAPDAPAG